LTVPRYSGNNQIVKEIANKEEKMKRNLSMVAIALTWLVLTGFKDASVEEIKTLTETFAESYIKDTLKIAYVDLEKATLAVPEIEKAMDNLDRDVKKKQAIIDKTEKELKELDEMYKKQEMLLSDTAKEQKRKEFQDKLLKYQQKGVEFEQDLVLKRKELRELQMTIVDKMKDIVKEIGSKEKYILILQLPESNILYDTDNVVNITPQLIEKYNKLYPQSKGSKK
jgi:outer membrane protein